MTPQGPLSADAIVRLLKNTEPWLSCDDCFEQLDIAIEVALLKDGSLSAGIRVHLNACAVCHEEAQSLATLVAPTHCLTDAEAIARLEDALA